MTKHERFTQGVAVAGHTLRLSKQNSLLLTRVPSLDMSSWVPKVVGAVAAATALLTASAVLADCGQPPAAVEYSRTFYQAQAKYYASATSHQGALNASIPGIGDFGGSYGDASKYEGWESLTIDEASHYIQQETQYREAAIIRESPCANIV